MFFLLLTVLAITLIYFQKYKYAFLIHIFIVTQGFRFFMASQLQAFGVVFQPTDLSIVFLIFTYNHYLFRNNLNFLKKQFRQTVILKLFKWFIILIIIESFIDYYFNMVGLFDILKTNRKWLTLAVLPLYHYLKENDIEWIIKAIVLITLLQILIVPLQPVLNFEIPGSIRADDAGFGGIRYGLMPYFWFLSFWYIYCTSKLKVKQKIVLLLIIVSVLFFTQARKNILAIIISIIFIYSLKLSVKNVITSAVIILIFCTFFFSINNSSRIVRFRSDLTNMFVTSLETYNKHRYSGDYGNAAFRYFLFLERYKYLKQYPCKLLFGYGFIHEKNLQNNPFKIKVSGIYALDIGDISWAYLLIRYGVFGMTFMALIVFITIRRFVMYIDNDPLFKVGFLYMVTISVLSFGDSFLSSPLVFLVPYMILMLAKPVVLNSQAPTKFKELVTV